MTTRPVSTPPSPGACAERLLRTLSLAEVSRLVTRTDAATIPPPAKVAS